MSKIRISDSYPILVEAKTDEERYIIEEAKSYLDETIFSSYWGANKHVDNVVKLGRGNIGFIMEIMRENNNPQGMYAHFLLDVVFGLYKDDLKVEGFLGVTECVKMLLKLYDSGAFKLMDDVETDVNV